MAGMYFFLLIIVLWLPGSSEGEMFVVFNVKLVMFWPIALYICYILIKSRPFSTFPNENCALPFGIHQVIGSGALLGAGISLFLALVLFLVPFLPFILKDVDDREFGIEQLKRELEIMDNTIDEIRSGTQDR